MDPFLTGVATGVLVEGAKFLYQQAGELLGAWRRRRKDAGAPLPELVEPPASVIVSDANPRPEAPDPGVEDTLNDLKDMIEKIKDGAVDPASPEARRAVGDLRDLLQSLMGTTITFDGEGGGGERRVEDVHVVVKRVSGDVAGLRAALDKLGDRSIKDVTVHADDVEHQGRVTGVDLT